MTRSLRPGFVALALAMPFLVGPLTYIAAGLSGGMGPDVLAALVESSTQRRHNPLLAGVAGIIPVLFLLGVLAIVPRWTPHLGWGPITAWAGLIPIAGLEAWAHWTFWTLYLPGRVSPGFPHGLELVIVPIFWAPIGALVGLAVGLLAARSSRVTPRSEADTGDR